MGGAQIRRRRLPQLRIAFFFREGRNVSNPEGRNPPGSRFRWVFRRAEARKQREEAPRRRGGFWSEAASSRGRGTMEGEADQTGTTSGSTSRSHRPPATDHHHSERVGGGRASVCRAPVCRASVCRASGARWRSARASVGRGLSCCVLCFCCCDVSLAGREGREGDDAAQPGGRRAPRPPRVVRRPSGRRRLEMMGPTARAPLQKTRGATTHSGRRRLAGGGIVSKADVHRRTTV